jgi:hypothetical protein
VRQPGRPLGQRPLVVQDQPGQFLRPVLLARFEPAHRYAQLRRDPAQRLHARLAGTRLQTADIGITDALTTESRWLRPNSSRRCRMRSPTVATGDKKLSRSRANSRQAQARRPGAWFARPQPKRQGRRGVRIATQHAPCCGASAALVVSAPSPASMPPIRARLRPQTIAGSERRPRRRGSCAAAAGRALLRPARSRAPAAPEPRVSQANVTAICCCPERQEPGDRSGGQVLGTGTGLLRAGRGGSRHTPKRQRSRIDPRKTRREARLLHPW